MANSNDNDKKFSLPRNSFKLSMNAAFFVLLQRLVDLQLMLLLQSAVSSSQLIPTTFKVYLKINFNMQDNTHAKGHKLSETAD
jgi:hypothetical protein